MRSRRCVRAGWSYVPDLLGRGGAGSVKFADEGSQQLLDHDTQAAACPHVEEQHEGGGDRWQVGEADKQAGDVGAQFMSETVPFSSPDLPILLSNIMIHLKQSCSLIKDIQVCLKDQPQNLFSFEDLKDQR